MNKNKRLGFTLAEVLIVIGIIGVVAALTLPNLNHATGDKEKVTKVKKIYSALTEAVDRAQAIYGPFDTWFKDLNTNAEKSERFAKRVTEFLKVSKDCGTNKGCWADNPFLDSLGDKIDFIGDSYLSDFQAENVYMVTLSDGMSLGFRIDHIKVDIDGPNKGKTQYGNDIFDFSIYDEISANQQGTNSNQIYPSRNPSSWTGDYEKEASYHGNYATAWVIENGNLDYLKCPDELNWETKTSYE